jgi:hypothetical protein
LYDKWSKQSRLEKKAIVAARKVKTVGKILLWVGFNSGHTKPRSGTSTGNNALIDFQDSTSVSFCYACKPPLWREAGD